MRRTFALAFALVALIYVRASSANFVPVYTFWWWCWIIATVVVAWCGGYAHGLALQMRKRKKENK